MADRALYRVLGYTSIHRYVDRTRTQSARVIERDVAAARMGDAAPTGTPGPTRGTPPA